MKEIISEILEHYDTFGYKPHQYPNAAGMWRFELESLAWLALNAPPGDFLETGFFCGSSAVLLCLAKRIANHGGLVYSTDLDFESFGGIGMKNILRKGKFQDIHKTIKCNTKNLQSELFCHECDFHGGARFELSLCLFDAWHSFRAVVTEFESVKPFLVPGAIVAFHDCSPQPFSKEHLDQALQYAKSNLNELMSTDMPDIDPKDLGAYHKAEVLQDFRIDEAVAYLMDKYDMELVDMYIPEYKPRLDIVPEGYVRGKTSPYHALAALRKK